MRLQGAASFLLKHSPSQITLLAQENDHVILRPEGPYVRRSSRVPFTFQVLEDVLHCHPMQCASCGKFYHVRFKEIVGLTIAVNAAVVVFIQAQQVVELVSGESTSTLPLEMAVLNGWLRGRLYCQQNQRNQRQRRLQL